MPTIGLQILLQTATTRYEGARPPDDEELALIKRVGPVKLQTELIPCAYLSSFHARNLVLLCDRCKPELYEELLAKNYRRSGDILYRPVCTQCTACRSLRVLVDEFTPNRSMRRCWQRNADLKVRVLTRHMFTKERHRLYQDYILRRHRAGHGSDMTGDELEFFAFLTISPLPGPRCVEFRLGRKLVAVGVFDETPNAYSALYCYYDCDHAHRSLGTFNILWLIEHARANAKKYVYLGYCIDQCPTMSYKTRFVPHERWCPDGRWERVDRPVQGEREKAKH